MRRSLKIALAFLFIPLFGVVAWQVAQSREPVFQGRPLSSWLRDYTTPLWVKLSFPEQGEEFQGEGHPEITARRLKANEAVRHIGTSAVPTLLRMLRARDSALKVKLMGLANRQHIIRVQYTPAYDLNSQAMWAFEALGAEGRSALPELLKIADQHISSGSQGCAILAVGYIGPSAREAVPSLLRWATDATTNADWEVRDSAMVALSRIGAEPARVVPVLTNALHRLTYTRTNAIEALRRFGPDAKVAVPALTELLRSDDFFDSRDAFVVKSLVTNAVKELDPETAAKAGMK